MDLLNISFAILIFKISFSVLPFVFGIFLITSSKQTKRKIRSKICGQLFGINDAISLHKFVRFIYVVGGVLIVFGLTTGWYLVLQDFFRKD